MSRTPFNTSRQNIAAGVDQSSEFGWGPGSAPAMNIDFSGRSGIPLADPDHRQQMLDLRASKRTDLNNPNEPDLPAFAGGQGPARAHYQAGNTERYGAGPPLVRKQKYPDFCREKPPRPSRMERAE